MKDAEECNHTIEKLIEYNLYNNKINEETKTNENANLDFSRYLVPSNSFYLNSIYLKNEEENFNFISILEEQSNNLSLNKKNILEIFETIYNLRK
jgi:hypothetical protein